MFVEPVFGRNPSFSVGSLLGLGLVSKHIGVTYHGDDLYANEEPKGLPSRPPVVIVRGSGCHESLDCRIHELHSIYCSVGVVYLSIELCFKILSDLDPSLDPIVL